MKFEFDWTTRGDSSEYALHHILILSLCRNRLYLSSFPLGHWCPGIAGGERSAISRVDIHRVNKLPWSYILGQGIVYEVNCGICQFGNKNQNRLWPSQGSFQDVVTRKVGLARQTFSLGSPGFRYSAPLNTMDYWVWNFFFHSLVHLSQNHEWH